MFSGNVKGTLWIEENIEDENGISVEPDSISLSFRSKGGQTTVMELEIE